MRGMQGRRAGRGAVRGIAVPLFLVGLWGALVPFVGPSFNFNMGGGGSWLWNESHATLHLAPGIAAMIGALLLFGGRQRTQVIGGVLAAVGGIWFVISPSLHPLWASSQGGGMTMNVSAAKSALEGIGYHYGTGIVIAMLAALALGLLLAHHGAAGSAPGAEPHATSAAASRPADVGTDRDAALIDA